MKKIGWEHQSHEDESKDEVKNNYYEDSYDNVITLDMKNAINTPFGIFDVNDKFNPLKQFELWIGHTNFIITPNIVKQICNTEGVEALNLISRYRFLLAVGKMFTMTDVRRAIEKKICGAE